MYQPKNPNNLQIYLSNSKNINILKKKRNAPKRIINQIYIQQTKTPKKKKKKGEKDQDLS